MIGEERDCKYSKKRGNDKKNPAAGMRRDDMILFPGSECGVGTHVDVVGGLEKHFAVVFDIEVGVFLTF